MTGPAHLSGLSTSSCNGTPKTRPLPFAPPRRALLPITKAPGYPPPAPAEDAIPPAFPDDDRACVAEVAAAAAAAASAAAASGSRRADAGAGLPPRSSTHPSPGLILPPPAVLLWGLPLGSPKMSFIVSSSDCTAWSVRNGIVLEVEEMDISCTSNSLPEMETHPKMLRHQYCFTTPKRHCTKSGRLSRLPGQPWS